MKTGIYKIECNGKYYIGSSKNINKRWLRHINDLKNNKHVNIHLQRVFNKYGIEKFNFSIIEECNVETLLIREQYYLDLNKNGFNIGKNASGGDNLTNNPNKEDIILKIKNTVNSKIVNMSDEERKEKWSRGYGSDNPNYGNTWSEEMKLHNSSINKGKIPFNKGKSNIELYGDKKAKEISEIISNNAKERIGDKNPFFGRNHTEESKNKIREKRLGKKPTNRIKLSVNDKVYHSYQDASNELGLPVVTIRWRCLSNNPKFSNYFLI